MKSMKAAILILSAIFVSSLPALALSDDFSGASLNTSLWTANIPYSDSVSTLENGYLKLRNGGGIITASDQGTYTDITGRFSYAGSSYDQFGIMLRADESLRFGSYGTFSGGISVDFNLRSGDQGGFNNNIKINNFLESMVWTATYSLDVGSSFDFRVLDTGSQISVFINDLENPLLSGTTSFRVGEQIGFQNREGAGNGSSISAGSETRIENISIVPEPSSAILFLGAIGIVLSIRSRKANGHNA